MTNMYDNIEIWGLKSKVKENMISIKASWNCITVANTCGDIYYMLEDGVLTRHDPVTRKDVAFFKDGHKKAIAYELSTSDDKYLFTFGWDGLAIIWLIED